MILFKIERLRLEEAIIGGSLLEDKYAMAAKWLEPKNFHNKECRFLFECMAEMYPTTPLDILTLAAFIRKKFGNPGMFGKVESETPGNYPYILTKLTGRISSTANLEFYCILVWEFDVAQKFYNLILQHACFLQSEVHKSAIKEILAMLESPWSEMGVQGNFNILAFIQEVITYLERIDYPESELNEYNTFYAQIDQRITHAKKIKHMDTVIHNLNKMAELNSEDNRTVAIANLIEAIKTLVFSPRLPSNFLALTAQMKGDLGS